nr:MAG TPA: hypothetical protein [Caudoviricetes sp.]
MAKHYNQAVLNSVSERVAEAVAVELQEQPWWLRYKGTIMLVLQAIAWVAGVIPVYLADAPEWTIILVGGIGFFITTLTNRLTVDGVTPSMAPRLADQAERREAAEAPTSLPVYTGPTTAGE